MSTRRMRKKPIDDAKTYILSCTDKDGFMPRFIDHYKGRGVFATHPIEPGDFVLEYRGKLLTQVECKSRKYSEIESTFLFDFQWQNHHLCLDASEEDGSLGRLVNDNHKNPNCVMKKIIVDDKPHLCLFSLKKIEIGDEIDYNYGDSKWPWRSKLKKNQAPAAALENETSPVPQMLNDGPNPDQTCTQVKGLQTPAAALENETSPVPQMLNDGPNPDQTCTQVKGLQTPAAALENETSPVPQMLNDGPNPDQTCTQVFTVQGFSLVDYPYSDETDEDGMENEPPTPHLDVILGQNDIGPDVSNHLYDSDETVVKETCDEASPSNHSNNQSDDELVPPLRRTKSIMMDRVQDFTHSLYDSDSPEETTFFKPERDSQKLRRRSCRPIQMNLMESDDSNLGSEEEYIPNPIDESTESDSSMELTLGKEKKNKGASSSQSKFKPRERSRSSRESRSESSRQSKSKPRESGSRSSRESGSESSRQSKSKPRESGSRSSRESGSESSRQSKSKPRESGSRSSRESGSESSRQSKSKPRESGSRSSSHSQFDFSQRRLLERCHDPTQRFPNSRVDGNEKEIATYSENNVSVPLEEEQYIIVSPTLKKDDGSRSYNKKHFCFYCRKFVQKMSRHLWRKHQDELDVAKAFSFPKNSKERKLQLDYIRNKGNFEHNSHVLETQKGKLIPCKQPGKKSEGHKFAHCIHCYGLFSRRAMWRHFKVCSFKPESTKPGKNRVQALCAFAEPSPSEYTDAYWKFLSVMIQDKIAVAIKGDNCILNYGFRLFKKNEKIVSQHQYIRQKLRELGRLLLEAKKITHVKTIQELIKPEQYSQVVRAAKNLSGFSEETGIYQCPSLARKVGHSLHSLAMFIKSEGLKKKDKETIKDAEEFAQLYLESWRFDIAGQALTQLNRAKWNAPQLLPLTQDIQRLHCYLEEKLQQHLKDLKEHRSSTNWKELAKVTLTQVMLFNRRRAGEVSRMRLSAYLSKDTSEEQGDVNLALTALEQKLCRHFVRIAIVGKRGRKVPVLLTPSMRESLDALTESREECGVLKDNEYLFALPQSDHYLRACDCLRQFVSECADIKNPQALTSIQLRKHIATLSTVLNLKTTELDQLADFLGHNIAVHRKHYRLPESTLQLAKVSKVLLAMEQGRLGDYKGKSLDEIQVDVNETIDMEGPLAEDIEDVSMLGEDGSDDEVSMSSTQECTSTSQSQNQGVSATDVSMPREEGSEDEVSMSSLQECSSTSQVQNRSVSAKKRGKQTAVKRSWTPDECAAVDTHLRRFIVMNQVPGKEECQRCITAEPQALRNRDWKAVKYYVKNRITALRRKV
ncbi:uncharacterized protein LOC128016052 isoform X20 [Carassius gibelio]|uniref:uncharacterized protein LOC128016052 isoform X14 n=1 Tax=Carassius gibelio TaxID=101364 RepID=UPI00227986CF|nr:uncharacterized protein LOC128016052 isoform X14 [Carassius gibelio]XP_052456348.1 uncharacterized protein LOC128016052 isoform X15 [Carassius gibelio]XP_052456349.1 uncharacterized protein LOC128016052 isoform X16 [Carassius gibelio]XP_052456350.1 uncharacterized protein LOC128016052 isoform X17 [Carassius gibelio]XP_052456351.1 uncharacterized protein LOC128016052 isoform X18 [Carassius gibelio]XP_052456352.1 uncharacterized protein LOC128016052 isoform X19 [Carassius gibelio]XP_05245635